MPNKTDPHTAAPAAPSPAITPTPLPDKPVRPLHLLHGPTLARVAGLPAARVEPLAATPVADALGALHDLASRLAALGAPVSDALHAVVPHLADAGTRRAVLAWRRAAHAGDPAEVPDRARDAAARVAGPEALALLDQWLRVAHEAREARARIAREAEAARLREAAALRALLDEPALADALAVVSPGFLRHVPPSDAPLGRKRTATAYRYAVRAALKPTPMSSLAEPARTLPHHPGAPGARVTLHPLLTRALLRAAAPHEGVRERLAWLPNRSLRSGTVSSPHLLTGDGYVWSFEEAADARERPDLTRPLPDPGTLSSVRLARLLESGLADLVDPCPQRELPDWLADALAGAPEPARSAAAPLARAARHLRALADADAAERTALLDALDAELDASLRALGVADRWPLPVVPTVYEDRTTAPVRPLEPVHRAALDRYAERTLARARLSPAYESLVAAFVERFGRGGVCDDVYGFCRDVASGAWPLDFRGAPDGPPVGAGRSSARPSLGLLCQATGPSDAPGADRPLVVVNGVGSGTGSLVARNHRDFDGFDGELRDWLRALYPEAGRLAAFVPAWDCHPLQEASTGVLPALGWPLGPRRPGPHLDVDELRLVHDPARNALELRDGDGVPVAAPYLGTVPQHLITGPPRVLTVLADPWTLPPLPAAGRLPGAGPRRTEDGTVTARASWRVVPGDVPRRRPDEPVAAFVEHVDRWRRALGLPAEVFVKADTHQVHGAGARLRKPQWLAFASPEGLAVLAGLAGAADGAPLLFAECLPARADLPEPRPGEAPRAVEHLLHYALTDTSRTHS
ncbi:hypothetical protein ABT160_16035 [Streptomyces sp. NPDC001941]|uniref:hypothetical protein n=1 Tax=Streptomyces sp. NPDC001941 TaxID=3154659 RepID=UPI00332A2394